MLAPEGGAWVATTSGWRNWTWIVRWLARFLRPNNKKTPMRWAVTGRRTLKCFDLWYPPVPRLRPKSCKRNNFLVHDGGDGKWQLGLWKQSTVLQYDLIAWNLETPYLTSVREQQPQTEGPKFETSCRSGLIILPFAYCLDNKNELRYALQSRRQCSKKLPIYGKRRENRDP